MGDMMASSGTAVHAMCDEQHASIVLLAGRLHGWPHATTRDDVQFAIKAYDYVLSEVKYCSPSEWYEPASATLASKRGNCVNKACLLAAILRAGGLKAGFYVVRAPQREYSLDSTIDLAIVRGNTCVPRVHPITFDGENDALADCLVAGSHNVSSLKDVDKLFASKDVDRLFTAKSRDSQNILDAVDLSIEFVRNCGSMFSEPEKLHKAIYDHLLYQHPELTAGRSITGCTSVEVPKAFCDSQHPSVQKVAASLRSKVSSDEEFAAAAFKWVRDEIRYYFLSDWQVSVQETLASRVGVCSTKSCLLTAILRAGGLSAAFYVTKINPREVFKLTPEFLRKTWSVNSLHVLSAVYLHGRWIPIDSMLDSSISRPVLAFSPDLFAEFDGKNAALGILTDAPGELQWLDSIDHILSSKRSRVPEAVIRGSNIALETVRLFGFYTQHIVESTGVDWDFAYRDVAETSLLIHHTDLVKEVLEFRRGLPEVASKL
ncbi:hypothetical protein CYMTET_41214 [Cymbomonas tetramitiformis]|uniref:Transglutaminase-like domain-containing protein n=1 Tax=Cymbomonas tetramitiformis TaxID=36881 RepID=A0AAE0C6I6_9CHLO|nr:hypothetical protein CYMTET_41214 [Cymbomonas tetramitiformis]